MTDTPKTSIELPFTPEDVREGRARQMPPADQLFVVREQIKELKDREQALRQLLLSDPTSRQGNNFLAEIVTVTQQRTDLKELRAMHAQLVEEYTFPHAIQNVELRAIDQETGEITARKRRA